MKDTNWVRSPELLFITVNTQTQSMKMSGSHKHTAGPLSFIYSPPYRFMAFSETGNISLHPIYLPSLYFYHHPITPPFLSSPAWNKPHQLDLNKDHLPYGAHPWTVSVGGLTVVMSHVEYERHPDGTDVCLCITAITAFLKQSALKISSRIWNELLEFTSTCAPAAW